MLRTSLDESEIINEMTFPDFFYVDEWNFSPFYLDFVLGLEFRSEEELRSGIYG